jgi:predicted secreted Zn-dependent protease
MLNSTSTGLRIQNDSPTYYQIYGNTASDLHTQIAQCAPGANATSSAEYTGETNYNLTWQYSVAVTDTGCSLRNVQVGLHISTALPLWQPTSAVTTGLTDRWQQFIQALATHEHGHAQLDANYAGLLEQQLETLGNLDCNSVTDTIQSTVNTIVQALNNANNTYDQQTNHGAAQGAILPNY